MKRWAPGDHVVFRSAPRGVIHVAEALTVVRDDEELVALYICPEAAVRRRSGRRGGGPRGRLMVEWDGGYDESVWGESHTLRLYTPGAAHSKWLMWDADWSEIDCWYVNLEAPWRRTPVGFDSSDHTLDIVVGHDLSWWRWKDADELEWFVDAGRITPEEAKAIRAEGARVIERLLPGESPFCDGWERWRPDPSWPVPTLPEGWDHVSM